MDRFFGNRSVGRMALAAFAASVVWAVWGIGCEQPASDPVAEPPPRPAESEVAEADQPSQQQPSQPTDDRQQSAAMTPVDLLGVDVAAWDYRVVEGDRQGEVVRVVLEEQADDADDALPWRRRRADGRVEHLGLAEDGSVVLGEVEDPDEGVRTTYDPPLTLIPADLSPGESREFTVAMRVVNLDPPHRQRGSGEATRTVHYVGDEVLETPAGSFTARRYEATLRAEMRLASVSIDATEWYTAGVGLVAEEVDERVRAALVFGSSDQQTLRLEELP